jgi:lipoate-protein ligase A
MAADLKLFQAFEQGGGASFLRVYAWKPSCISLGYAQKEERWIDGKKASSLGWEVVRRPTGGGIVFHNEAEVTYSIVTELENPILPKGLVPSYKRISEAIVCALALVGVKAEICRSNVERRTLNVGLCFSFPAEYEIVVGGKKIVGSAQKRGRRTLLQQGSIFVRRPPKEIFSALKKAYADHNAVSVEEVLGREAGFTEISAALVEGFKECLGVNLGL